MTPEMKPIATAPLNVRILATDGKWWAVVVVYGPPDYDRTFYLISHWAVCQESDWELTLWCELPEV